jgi:hypothetical protein
MPAVAAAAIVLIGVTWTLFFASPDESSETTVEAEVTWDEEAMSYGTSIDYPAVVQSEFDDLSSDEERTLLAELNEAVIL